MSAVTQFIRDEVFRMVSERDLSQVDEFTIAQDVAHLLSVQKDKDTLSREEIDDIVAQAVNEWLLEASSGDVDAMQEPTTRRVKAGNLADKPIFWDGPNRTKRRRKDGTMVRVVSRRARPIAGNSKFDDSDSELDTWKSKASQPVLKEYNGMSKVMMQPKRARRVGLPMSQDKTSTSTARVRAKTTHWIQCDQCNKWRGVAEGTFKVCQAWESFSCAKLENCDCDEPCDDAVPRDTGRVLSESSLKWVCCDECDKWRPVDEKASTVCTVHTFRIYAYDASVNNKSSADVFYHSSMLQQQKPFSVFRMARQQKFKRNSAAPAFCITKGSFIE
eukprot:GEMP01041288.1.p1 GENE.GEMP01041288.1~~GEMP01041288.1.p1  ORF type:complete len:331 (+),score=65.90 GEMP01041288.1:130-1122(+)